MRLCVLPLVHLPRILGTAWDSGVKGFDSAKNAFSSGNTLAGVSSSLQLVILAIPMIGIMLVLLRSARGGGRWVWRSTDGRPILRSLTLATVVTGGALLAYSWVSPHNYTPIGPGERGTVIESVKAVKSLPDLPKEETPKEPGPSTTTTTEPMTGTTVAARRGSGTGTDPAAGVTTTTVGTTTTEPATATTRVSPTTTAAP